VPLPDGLTAADVKLVLNGTDVSSQLQLDSSSGSLRGALSGFANGGNTLTVSGNKLVTRATRVLHSKAHQELAPVPLRGGSEVNGCEAPASGLFPKRLQEQTCAVLEVGAALNDQHGLLDAKQARRGAPVSDNHVRAVR
jgi:hypothetical protein